MTALKGFLIATILFFSTVCNAAPQHPEYMEIFGGSGGGPFKLECPTRFEGAVIRRGAWITALGLVCGGQRPSMTGARDGPTEEWSCPAGGTVTSIKYGFTRDGNNPKYLDYLELHCSRGEVHCFHTGDGCWDRHPNRGSYNGYGYTNTSSCRSAQHGYGFIGRSGAAIDALALVCFPAPPPGPRNDFIRPIHPPHEPPKILER